MNRRLGIAQILLSGLCFGFLGIFGKMAFQKGVSPGEFLSLRFLIGGVLLLIYFLATRPRALKIPKREVAACTALGLIGYAIFSSCYFQALKGLSASMTVLLLYTYPVIVAIGAWIFLKETISRAKWIALPLAMIGLVLLIWGDIEVRDPQAIVFGLAAALFYSIYILTSSRALKSANPLVAVTFIQLAAGLGLSALYWRSLDRFQDVVTRSWWLMLAVALISTVAAMSLFLAGLKKLKNWEVSILSTAEPVTGIALALVFLGERLSLAQGLGALSVLAAFLIVAWPTKRTVQ